MACFLAVMARTKETACLVEGSEGAPKLEVPSFDFGASVVSEKDLALFAKRKWFAAGEARVPEGEMVPQPLDDEVVVFREFFYAGLRFPVIQFVLEVMRRFGLKFHQLTPSCFTRLSVFVWACRSQGVEVDVDAFLWMHIEFIISLEKLAAKPWLLCGSLEFAHFVTGVVRMCLFRLRRISRPRLG